MGFKKIDFAKEGEKAFNRAAEGNKGSLAAGQVINAHRYAYSSALQYSRFFKKLEKKDRQILEQLVQEHACCMALGKLGTYENEAQRRNAHLETLARLYSKLSMHANNRQINKFSSNLQGIETALSRRLADASKKSA